MAMPMAVSAHRALATPSAAAAMIPLAAAGRQPLFFFGTLMDLEVLATVVDRPIPAAALLYGRLDGVRRVRARGFSYPVLIPDPGGAVEGRLWPSAGRRDIHRVNHFESDEYRAELRPIVDERGAVHEAWLFVGLDRAPMIATAEPWSLETWRRGHKVAFLAACDRWMADCGEPGRDDRPGCGGAN